MQVCRYAGTSRGAAGPIYALYGAREALLLPPLPMPDDAAINAFLDARWHFPAVREGFRQGLIAQSADALKAGVLRLAPVPVTGLQPVKTEPAKAELSGKPFVMPPRINPPRSPTPPTPRHKVSIEIAGQRADSLAGALVVRSAENPKLVRTLSTHKQGSDTHRLECSASGLPDTPFDLYYDISMQGGSPMRLLLAKGLSPVDQDTQQARWPSVLVPLLPLRYFTAELDRSQARTLAGGYVYLFLNDGLHRELQVNEQGALRDVDLGAHDGVGDARVARGHYTRFVVVPSLLNGVPQQVALAYSPTPLPWERLMQLGGIAPDDVRFTAAVKRQGANIAVDNALRKQLLQPVDLSSYDSGFNVESGIIGPIATALRPGPEQRDALYPWRNDRLPVVYLKDPSGTTRRLQIGVFFDGTGNNKDRDRNRLDRDITNVAKLYDLYPNQRELNIRSIYVRGVGTKTSGDDTSVLGLAFALGDEGGEARIALARKELKDLLKAYPDRDELVFDIFGFSRGAALARHFVNLIHAGLAELQGRCTVRVRFVGLFDTVGSFYQPGDTDEGPFNLHLGPASAEHVVHLTAHHEQRKNFPLTSVQDAAGNLPAHFTERALPGVHADLGGGYGVTPEALAVATWDTAGHGGTRERLYREMRERGNEVRPVGPQILLEVQRKPTHKELAILALREMDKYARTHGAPLRPVPPDDPAYNLPLDLDAQLFVWRAVGAPLEKSMHYLKNYIHTSHRDMALTTPDLAHAPEPHGLRRVFPNDPPRAAQPAAKVPAAAPGAPQCAP